MKNKKQIEMYQRITAHGENLKKLFNLPAETDPVKLCKKLFTIEKQLNRIMCNLCNTNNVQGIEAGRVNGVWVTPPETTEEEQDKIFDGFRAKLEKIVGKHDFIFFNHDPRGYSLKIKDSYMKEYWEKTGAKIEADWGGYGIIAPDFSRS